MVETEIRKQEVNVLCEIQPDLEASFSWAVASVMKVVRILFFFFF